MKKYKLDQLECKTMEEFLSSFTPPNTYEIYDNVNDRSAVLNKYNFSQEIVHSKDPQKESLINKLDKEIQHYSEELKEINDTLINVNNDIQTLNAPKQIKEINLELEKIIAINNTKQINKDVSFKFYDKYSPMFSYSMNNSNKEYMESLGLKYIINIPKEHEDLLKKDLESGKITKEIYETKYSNLMLAYTTIEVNESYFDNFFKLYFDFIKPAIEVSPLNWLHESHLFYPTKPSLMINDIPKQSRYLKAFDRDLGEKSILERLSIQTESRKIRYLKDDYMFEAPTDSELRLDYRKNSDDNNYIEANFTNPIYTSDVLSLNKIYLVELAGLGNIFKDHPIYKDHLAHKFVTTFLEKINNEDVPKEFNYEENLFYLQNGYEKNSGIDKLRTILNKINIKDNNLLTINSLEELNSLNFSKEEKTKLFLNLIVGCLEMQCSETWGKTRVKGSLYKASNTMSMEGDTLTSLFITNKYDYNRQYSNNRIKYLEQKNGVSSETITRKSLSKKIGFHIFKANLFNRNDFLSEVTNEDKNNPKLITKRNVWNQERRNYQQLTPSIFEKLKNGYEIVGLILGDKKNELDYQYKVIIVQDEQGNQKKYDFNDITRRFPFVKTLLDLDEDDDGFTSSDILINTNKTIEISKEDFDNLWNKDLNIEEDFEIIHNLYMNTIESFDLDKNLDKNLMLDNIWNKFYKPWFQMEEDKIDFWVKVSNNIVDKIQNETTNELKEFYDKIEYLLKDVYEKIMSQYSYEARTSEYFEFRLNIDSLIRNIIDEDKKSITTQYEINKFHTNVGKYDQNNYINNDFFKDAFNNSKLKEFLSNEFNRRIKNIGNEPEFGISRIGKHGVIVLNKMLNFVIEKLNPLNRPKEVNPLSLYSNEVRELINKMENKYGKGFIDMERPPYFPSVKHAVKNVNLVEKENQLTSEFIKYYNNRIKPMIDVKSKYNNYIIPEYYDEKRWSGIFRRYRSLEKEINDSIFIGKIINGIEVIKDKEYELNKVIELEKNRSDLVETHNKMAKEFKDKKEERKLLLPKYEETIKKMKELKLENYVVTNNIDKEKFIVTMKAIVDMTLNEFNKDKIIDLTKLDNIDNNLKNFEELLSSFNTITKNALISNYILHINNLYEKRGLVDKFDLVEINPVQYEIILENIINENVEDIIIEEQIDSSNKIRKIKAYEGNHFPLFIDKESLSIWSVEWTTRYPTLNIYVMPSKYSRQ